MENRNPMEYKPVFPLLMSMAIPPMISMLIQSLYNIIDSIFVSQLGEEALTAVSLIFPLQNLSLAISCGIGIAMNAFIARHLGAKDDNKASYYATQGIVMSLAHSLLFLIIGLFFIRPFLNMFTTNQNVINYGMQYGMIVVSLVIGQFIHLAIEKMFQATGNMMMPMIMQIFGAVINIILDPILIFGYFGLPAFGVAGAAIATVIGQFCGMMIGYWITKKKIDSLEIKGSNFSFSTDILARIYQVGVPAILMQSVLSFMTVFMNMILAPISAMAITVFSVYYKLQNFLNMAVLGITNALIPIVAYNNGARRKDRAMDAIQFSLILSIGIMAIGTIVFQLFPKQLLAMFSANEEMYGLGVPALKIISFSFVFAGISMVLCAAFQALNKANTSLVITLARQLVILIPLTYGLMKCFGINVGWYAFVVTEFICAIYSLIEWKKLKGAVTK